MDSTLRDTPGLLHIRMTFADPDGWTLEPGQTLTMVSTDAGVTLRKHERGKLLQEWTSKGRLVAVRIRYDQHEHTE